MAVAATPSMSYCHGLRRFSLPSLTRVSRVQVCRRRSGGAVRNFSAQELMKPDSSAVDNRSTQVSELWTWLVQTGVTAGGVKPSLVKEGIGLVAQKVVNKGEEVVQVPRKNWISVQTVKDSEIGRFVEGRRPWVTLALFLIHERANPSSAWRPYVDSLPQSLDSTLFWSDAELLELQGTQLLASTLSFREYVGSEFKQLQEELLFSNSNVFKAETFNLEAFLWAFGILRSRTFAPLTGEDLALVPLADLVNHGAVPGTAAPTWELRKGTGFFGSQDLLLVRAGTNFQAGEQAVFGAVDMDDKLLVWSTVSYLGKILMEYGAQKGNGQLALDYGFVEKQAGSSISFISTARDTFALTLEISESDRFFDDKADIAELNGYGSAVSFDLGSGKGPVEDMLTYLRLMVLDGPDAFLLEALFRNAAWGHISLPVSRENEEGICAAMLDGCRSALAAYTTTIDEDVRLLEAGIENPRLETAVVVRFGEKRVLEELQAWFEAHLARVPDLEYYAERRLRDLGLLDDKGFMTPWVFNQ